MRLKTPQAIIISSIIVSLVFLIGAAIIGNSFWTALGAFATCAAVIWAIFHQGILEWWRKPNLEITLYERNAPHLRAVPVGTSDKPAMSYMLTLQLLNDGKSIARGAQPLVTDVRSLENGKWCSQEGWLPVPLLWIFDEFSLKATGKPTEEKDLVPHRPYLFNLGQFSTSHPDTFFLLSSIIGKHQKESYESGEHCFEITVFALGVEPAKKYFQIKWDGGCSANFNDVKKKVRVFETGIPPWGRNF